MDRKVLINAMTRADILEIAALEKLCFSTPWSETSLLAELQKQNALFLVARDPAGMLCGYVGLNTVFGEGYVANIAVHPDCRRQGVAHQLIEALLQSSEVLGLSFVTLEVRRSNVPAINLYLSFGFTIVGVRKDFYTDPPEDGAIMTKYLNFEEPTK